MKIKLLGILCLWQVVSGCNKHSCECESPPTLFAFCLIDKEGNNVVDSYLVNNYRLYYLQNNIKTNLDITYHDSFPKYKYVFNSIQAQTLPSEKGINEFYFNYGAEDTDTIWMETEKISDLAYNIKTLKFNGQNMYPDSTYGVYLLKKVVN